MIRISSASTIILSLFFPIFWLVFFGSFTFGLFITNPSDLPFSFNGLIRWIFLAFYILFSLIIWFSFRKLKRIDLDNDYIYISNYFTTVKIPIQQIENVSCKSLHFRQLGKIVLPNAGRFGRNIFFIAEADKYNILLTKTALDITP
ncbi:MAG: hypothetical protein HOP11_06030 [Saprospiraceae bacterium]|nr:hypothetical protein [Saprospiraceae bacterium]